ncbi:MAG: hypothetical protein QNJ19_02965 [Woeseiaceae bacterium]|nr:hypothetical protein [Woeseiaceae bacterium]
MGKQLIVWLAVLCLAGCGGPPQDAEAEIRSWLKAGEQAAEDKDRRALMKMVAPGYTDSRGNDRRAVEGILRFYFLRQSSVALLTKVDSLEVFDGTAAEVRMTVGMAGGNDAPLGFSADAYRFALELELIDDEWQLISARWGRLGEDI